LEEAGQKFPCQLILWQKEAGKTSPRKDFFNFDFFCEPFFEISF